MRLLQLDAEWDPRPGYRASERERSERRADDSSQVFRNPVVRLLEGQPPRPGPDDVLVQVKACGLCGSDLHLYESDSEGYILNADPTRLPVVLGHEWAGVVVEVGTAVRALRPGDRVCGEPVNWCGACNPCRAGLPNQCDYVEGTGFSLNGGLADYLVTAARYCWKIDALQDVFQDEERVFEAGALVEPCAVAYNALFVRGGGFQPGAHVAVAGAGPVGLASIALARAAGAGTILAIDTLAERRDLALQLGATVALDPRAHPSEAGGIGGVMRELTGGDGIDVGVEAAGASPVTVPQLVAAMAPGGKLIQIGIGTVPTPLLLFTLQQRGINLYGSIGNSGSGIFPSVIRLIAAGRFDPTPMVTARFPLSRVLEALEHASGRRGGKVLVKP